MQVVWGLIRAAWVTGAPSPAHGHAWHWLLQACLHEQRAAVPTFSVNFFCHLPKPQNTPAPYTPDVIIHGLPAAVTTNAVVITLCMNAQNRTYVSVGDVGGTVRRTTGTVIHLVPPPVDGVLDLLHSARRSVPVPTN